MKCFVYILYSESHDKYYVGQTNDLQERLKRLNSGNSKYTAPYRPWVMVCSVEKKTRSLALQLETKLKNLSKDRKRKFIDKYGGNHRPTDEA